MLMKKITISLMIITGCAAAVIMLNHAGIAARQVGKTYSIARERFPVYVVQNTGDICSLWDEKHAHGRIVVHLGRFLHFMKSGTSGGVKSPMQITRGTRYADILAGDPAHFNNDPPNYRNFLWVAFQTNIAREIYNVIPPPDFMKRFDLTDQSAALKDIVQHEFGSPRIVATKLPDLAEPVLLNIDASFFASTDPARFLDTLLKSGLNADIVTVCLADDSPDVTTLDRDKTLEFIRLLSQRADIEHYTSSRALSRATK
jgi:hypothetical protein